MKICLISTSSAIDKGPSIVSKYLQENGHKTKIIFYQKTPQSDVVKMSKEADLIVVSANEQSSKKASEAITLLKPLDKPLAYAGIYASLYPERAIKETDLVIISKPRDTILELANKLQNFQRVADIENLWFKATEDQVIKN